MPLESPRGKADVASAFDRSLDVRAMNRSLPILETKAEFAKMQSEGDHRASWLR